MGGEWLLPVILTDFTCLPANHSGLSLQEPNRKANHGNLPENRESRRLSDRGLHSTWERPASDWPTTTSPYTIGQFGSGNKHAVNVLLRAKLFPVVFCGNHKLEFTTRPGRMQALEGQTDYNRVVVKHGGTDEDGTSVTYTEELSQTDEYGAIDWNCLGMAFREFVSNAIDAAIAVNRQANGNAKWPWEGVKVELVPEEKVRAKRGYTRVFVPADNEDVIRFFANLGKWFLHFSEPEAITQAILAQEIPQPRCRLPYRRHLPSWCAGAGDRPVCRRDPVRLQPE